MTEGATLIERQQGSELPNCRHHWLIESPQGPISSGVCKLCGTEREFYNSIPGPLWEDFRGFDSLSDLSRDRLGLKEAVVPDEEETSLEITAELG